MWCFWTREALKTETISICFQPSDEKAPRIWAVWASFCGETWSLEYGIWMDIIDIIGNLQNLMEINGNIGKPMEKIWQHPLGSIWIFLTFGIGSWAGCSNRRPPWGRCRWSRWSLSSHSLNKLPKFVKSFTNTFTQLSQIWNLNFCRTLWNIVLGIEMTNSYEFNIQKKARITGAGFLLWCSAGGLSEFHGIPGPWEKFLENSCRGLKISGRVTSMPRVRHGFCALHQADSDSDR